MLITGSDRWHANTPETGVHKPKFGPPSVRLVEMYFFTDILHLKILILGLFSNALSTACVISDINKIGKMIWKEWKQLSSMTVLPLPSEGKTRTSTTKMTTERGRYLGIHRNRPYRSDPTKFKMMMMRLSASSGRKTVSSSVESRGCGLF